MRKDGMWMVLPSAGGLRVAFGCNRMPLFFGWGAWAAPPVPGLLKASMNDG
jgi:hypothetical protein